MFVYKNRAISLRDLRDVVMAHKGTALERFVLRYKDDSVIYLSTEMGLALLAKLSAEDGGA